MKNKFISLVAGITLALTSLVTASNAASVSSSGGEDGYSGRSFVVHLVNHRNDQYDSDIVHVYARNLRTDDLTGDLLDGHIATGGDFKNITVYNDGGGCLYNLSVEFRDGSTPQRVKEVNVCNGKVNWDVWD